VDMNDYAPISAQAIPDQSVDLVTCYIGLHHASPEKLEAFVASVCRILRPNGIFILRDHDVDSAEMSAFVSLAHSVFNAGLGMKWEDNCRELRRFRSIGEWISFIETAGFRSTGQQLFQDNDPTRNALLAFSRIPHGEVK